MKLRLGLLGMFLFLVLNVFLGATVMVGNLHQWMTPHTFYEVEFDTVEGLKRGDDVRVEGVVSGKVEKVDLAPSAVVVALRMFRPLELKTGYKITIESSSALGGNVVAIRRGPGPDPIVLTPDSKRLVGQASKNAFAALGEAVEENRDSLRKVMNNVADTFGQTKSFFEAVNRGEGTLGKLAKDPALYDKAADAIGKLDAGIADLRAAAADVRDVTDKINKGEGTIAKLINTPELHDQVVKTVKNIGEEGKQAVASLREAADKINKGEGLVGRALNDRKVADDFAATVTNLRSTLEKAEKVADNLQKMTEKPAKGEGTLGRLLHDDKLIQDAESAVGDIKKMFGTVSRTKVWLQADSKTFFDTEVAISKAGIRIDFDETKYFSAGAAFLSLTADAEPVVFEKQLEEDEDDTIIKGEILAHYKIPWFGENHIALRGGLIEGKPGAAIDVSFDLLNHEFFVTLEARDAYGHVNDEDIDENVRGPMSRIWMKTPLWNRLEVDPKDRTKITSPWWQQVLHAVKVYAGASRLQDDPEFIVGIGIEFADDDLRTLIALLGTAR
jgi:phospholipid/cholesterol/gamma-HCH transport system substrate-binding protein